MNAVYQKICCATLPDDKAGQLIKHLFAYVNDENPETDDILIKAVFAQIKATLKRDLKKWEGKKEERSKSGILGNLKRYQKDLYDAVVSEVMTLEEAQKVAKGRIAIHSDTKLAVSVSGSVSVSDSVSTKVDEENSDDDDLVKTTEKIKQIEVVYEKFVEEIKQGYHQQWAEAIYMRLKIKKGSLTYLIQDFKNQLIIDSKIHPNTEKLRDHLNNWLNKLDSIGKLNQYKKQKVGAL